MRFHHADFAEKPKVAHETSRLSCWLPRMERSAFALTGRRSSFSRGSSVRFRAPTPDSTPHRLAVERLDRASNPALNPDYHGVDVERNCDLEPQGGPHAVDIDPDIHPASAAAGWLARAERESGGPLRERPHAAAEQQQMAALPAPAPENPDHREASASASASASVGDSGLMGAGLESASVGDSIAADSITHASARGFRRLVGGHCTPHENARRGFLNCI